MTPEQWTLVERLYHEASSVPASERDGWLSRACDGDDLVRREVESLLAQNASMTSALDDGALAHALGRSRENLTGKQLGGYTFIELIDEGGMGQVYRARDVALPRDVAVKVIAREFAGDPVRPSNPETRLVDDYISPLGFVPGKSGVFYLGRDPAGKVTAFRFYDYALRRSFDLAPPSRMTGGAVPVLTLSADERRLVYYTFIPSNPQLTSIEFHR